MHTAQEENAPAHLTAVHAVHADRVVAAVRSDDKVAARMHTDAAARVELPREGLIAHKHLSRALKERQRGRERKRAGGGGGGREGAGGKER